MASKYVELANWRVAAGAAGDAADWQACGVLRRVVANRAADEARFQILANDEAEDMAKG